MSTTIRNLSSFNVRAIRETLPADVVETTATTATFSMDAGSAARLVNETIARLPGRAHPKASLHSVRRRLVALVEPAAADDPRLAALSEAPAPAPAPVETVGYFVGDGTHVRVADARGRTVLDGRVRLRRIHGSSVSDEGAYALTVRDGRYEVRVRPSYPATKSAAGIVGILDVPVEDVVPA